MNPAERGMNVAMHATNPNGFAANLSRDNQDSHRPMPRVSRARWRATLARLSSSRL